VRQAASLFGNATVTISLIETELKSHQLGNQILLSTQASFRIFVFPTRPFPEFNISNSNIQLLEDFGDLNFLQFVTSKYLGGGESNAEQPAFFEFSVTSYLDTSKDYRPFVAWLPLFIDVNTNGDLRIISQPNQWGTLFINVVLTDLHELFVFIGFQWPKMAGAVSTAHSCMLLSRFFAFAARFLIPTAPQTAKYLIFLS